MQTPISFALDILLDCDTIEKAHKLARRYIKVLEACGSPPVARGTHHLPGMVNPIIGPSAIQQAPSTQRLLDAQAPTVQMAPLGPKIIGGEVNNGDGTKGKRKW